MKSQKAIIAVVILVILAVVAAVVVSNKNKDDNTVNNTTNNTANTSNTTSNTSTSNETPAANTVTISGFSFSPASMTVKVGTTVTWTNKDDVGHTVTADTASGDAPASQLIAKGQTYSFTFSKAGTYGYHCTPHPDMRGTVVVTE